MVRRGGLKMELKDVSDEFMDWLDECPVYNTKVEQ